jgi:hypothetical protein
VGPIRLAPALAALVSATGLAVAGCGGTGASPSHTPARTTEANLSDTLREVGPPCDRSFARGDFDGDGSADLAVIAAKRRGTRCEGGASPGHWVLAVAWSSGAAVSWPLPKCGAVQPSGSVRPTGVCQAFAAPDLDADGRSELAVKTLRGPTELQLYELLPSEAPKPPVEVAPGGPGPVSILPGQVFVMTFGSSPDYEDNLRCKRLGDRQVVIATDAEARGNRWAVYEGVWRFKGRQIAMLSHRTYAVTRDDPSAAELRPRGSICGSPIADGRS